MRKYPVQTALTLILVVSFACAGASRADTPDSAAGDSPRLSWILAQNETPPPEESSPQRGQLLVPNSLQPQPVEDGENCMTVCAAWGEDCTYINRGMGGTTRTCRRVCQQFTEECF